MGVVPARLDRPAAGHPAGLGGSGSGGRREIPPRRPHRAHGGRMLSGERGVRSRCGYRRPLIRRGKLKPRAAVSPPGEGEAGGDKWPLGTPCASPVSPEAGHGCTGVGPDPEHSSARGESCALSTAGLAATALVRPVLPRGCGLFTGVPVWGSPHICGKQAKLGGRPLKMLLP